MDRCENCWSLDVSKTSQGYRCNVCGHFISKEEYKEYYSEKDDDVLDELGYGK